MDEQQAGSLGAFIRTQRVSIGMSTRQLAAIVGVDKSQIIRLEHGSVNSPRAEILASIADAIDVELADLYGLAGYTRPSELPNFAPYLRAKYRDLSDGAVAEMEQFFAKLAREHGTTGPADGEDETS
jgi:transcriptional regulator with XRE-family HTH domain